MGFLKGLFETKASKNDAIARASGAVTSGLGPYMTGSSRGGWEMEKAVRDGMEKVIWVFRCVDAIATNASQITMEIRVGNPEDGQVLDDERIMRILNRRPNSYETSQQFRYRLSTQLLLSKRGVFIEIVKGNDGRPTELHLLPPHKTEPIPDPKTFISGYKVWRGDWIQDELKPEQVIWIRTKNHPLDPYTQMTPLMAAGLAVETDWLSRMFNRNFLANDGRPGLLIAVQGQLGMDDAEEIRRRFSGGPQTAGQTTVIEADGLSVQDMSSNPRDIQWLEAIQGAKEDILMAFGVPESILGNASGRTFDNADAEYENFWIHTMLPHCKGIGAGLDALTGDIEDETIIVYDYDEVDVLQRQKRRKHDKLLEELNLGAITIDEYREGTGKEPWNVPLTRIIWRPTGFGIAQNGEDQAAIANITPMGQPVQPDPAAAARQGAIEGTATGQRNFENIISARAAQLMAKADKLMLQRKGSRPQIETKQDFIDAEVVEIKEAPAHPYMETRAWIEGAVDGALIGWSARQEEVVNERLMHVKVRKHTRHWDGPEVGTKALDPGYVMDSKRWANDIKADVERILRPQVMKAAQSAARDMIKGGLLDQLIDDGTVSGAGYAPLEKLAGSKQAMRKIIDRTVSEVLEVVEKSATNQSNRIFDIVREMDRSGATMADIKKEVTRLVGSRSSWRKGLATNVTTHAMESVKHGVWNLAGDYATKTWWTEDDERVRKSHWEIEGDERKASGTFTVGKSAMMYPGDPKGPVEEVANCRCFLQWTIKK